MTPADIETYWTTAGKNNKLIRHTDAEPHVTIYTVEDALTKLKQGLQSPVLAIELPEISFVDNLSDNIRMISDTAVLIVKKCKQGDHTAISTAYKEMHTIALQLVSKLYNDRKKANDTGRPAPEKYIKQLDFNSISIVEVGPVFDGYYGWRINHRFNSPVNLDLDESQWENETEWKF